MKLNYWFKNPKNILKIFQTVAIVSILANVVLMVLFFIQKNNNTNVSNNDATVYIEARDKTVSPTKELWKRTIGSGTESHENIIFSINCHIGDTVQYVMEDALIKNYFIYKSATFGKYVSGIKDIDNMLYNLQTSQYWRLLDYNNPVQCPLDKTGIPYCTVGISDLLIKSKETYLIWDVA